MLEHEADPALLHPTSRELLVAEQDAARGGDFQTRDHAQHGAVRRYIKAHDGLLLANHGALAVAGDVYAAYYRMETIEHFATISLVARTLGRENLMSRGEVDRLQGLRGMYGIASPAPICTDDAGAGGRRPVGMPGRAGARDRRRAAGGGYCRIRRRWLRQKTRRFG